MPASSKLPAGRANSAAAKQAPGNFSAKGPMHEGMTDGSALIEKMHKTAGEIKDYVCEFEITVYKQAATSVEKGLLYFKQPRMLRSEETGEYHPGAVVVIRPDGKARAHYGGALKFFTVTLEPDDPKLLASNGYPMKDSDFRSLTSFLKKWLADGIKSRATAEPVKVEGVDMPVYVLEMYKVNEPQAVLKRVYVHPETHLPVRWDDHDYANPSLSRWRDVKVNTSLDDHLFQL